MSRWSLCLALVAVLALAGFASAAKAGKSAKKAKDVVNGTVVRVESEKLVIHTKANRNAADEEQTIQTDKDTKVTVDGKEGKLADLAAGMTVKVTPAKGTATKIDAKHKVTKPAKNANNAK